MRAHLEKQKQTICWETIYVEENQDWQHVGKMEYKKLIDDCTIEHRKEESGT